MFVTVGPEGELSVAGRTLVGGCLYRDLTGMKCPFCGISHSFVVLVHGDFADSIAGHPLGPAVALFFVYVLVAVPVTALFRRSPVSERRSFAVACCGLALASIVLWGLNAALDWPQHAEMKNTVIHAAL